MLRTLRLSGICASIVSLPFILSSAGCGTSAVKEDPNATPATASSTLEAGCCASHGSHSQLASTANETDSDIIAQLAKLPPEDRALAEKQKVCPVTDAPLGSMGVPTKVTLKGRVVFLCCVGCEEELEKNADKYLEKLSLSETK